MAQPVSMVRYQAAQQYGAAMAKKAAELKSKAREANKKLQEARKNPFVNIGIGVASAAAGGVAAVVADKAMPEPLYTIGGDEATGTGGVKLRASLGIAVGLSFLAQYEESDTLADAAKGAVGYATGKIAEEMIGDLF